MIKRPYRKKLNHRHIESKRCYTVSDIAKIFNIDNPTVLKWINKDLKTIDNQKPYMLFGSDIITWIKKHQPTKKTKTNPNKCYCTRCRNKTLFNYQTAWLKTAKNGNQFIQSRCEKCDTLLNQLGASRIKIFKAIQKGLIGSTSTPLKQISKKEKKHASIQPKERADQIPLF